MKILLDECLPSDFRHSFPDHETHSSEWAGLKGLSNGALLRAAEERGYSILLTVDHGIVHQQNPTGRKLSVIVMCAPTNRLQDLTPFVEAVLVALHNIQPGQRVVLRAMP
jgi:predicted nuclease of predicted toxin-antitoxin system